MGSLFYPWHFCTFGADTHICLPGYPAGQSCTHLFPKCWAILALSWHVIVELLGLLVATELLSQQESSPPSSPSFLSAIRFCSDPATRL